MIGTVSHNIKGLLTNLDGGLYIARSGIRRNSPSDTSDGLDLLAQNVEKLKQMIMDILMYAKERPTDIRPVPLATFVSEIEQTMALKVSRHAIDFQIRSDQAPDPLYLDAPAMMSALVNILDNAVDACLEDKDKQKHHICLAIFEKDGSLVLEIRDDGCGMDVDTKAKIFDLFFSSKQVKGTGFGLFIARNIIAQHQGTIAVESAKRRGTLFTILLPQKP
jgi:signal transduction histidine kinase